MVDQIQILAVDDHTLFREGVSALLASIPDMVVVGEASSGEDAIIKAGELQPNIVLMDIQMPGINGIEATRRILHTNPHIGVIVLTMYQDDDSVFAAMRAGARGYILKGADQEEMLRAIRAVASGEALFGPTIATHLMEFFSSPQPHTPPQAFPELTEREVLELIAGGFDNIQIALRLTISPKTVRNHVSNIFNKIQVANRSRPSYAPEKPGWAIRLIDQFRLTKNQLTLHKLLLKNQTVNIRGRKWIPKK